MHKHTLWSLGILLTLSACGSGANNQTEQTCAGADCTEQSINAPVGEQPTQDETPYEEQANAVPRANLRFPIFSPSWGLKRSIYERAVAHYEQSRLAVGNPRYASAVDFSQHSSKKRFYLFDLATGKVERHNVAAGKGSDPDGDGYATKFSNSEGSKMSSLGIYHTSGTYNGGNGYSMRIQGLESSNSAAMSRAVVVHPANYVSDSGSKAGRSWGCPALDPKISKSVIDRIKGGSVLVIGN
jgi:hypothetical protein